MPLTFEPFRTWYSKQKDGSRKKPKKHMIEECGFSWTTVNKIWADRFPIRSDVIETLCRVYKLKVQQVIEYRRDGERK